MKRERGSVLVMVMALLVILSLLGAGLLVRSTQDAKLTRAAGVGEQSFRLADAGAEVASANLFKSDPDRGGRKYEGGLILRKVLSDDLNLSSPLATVLNSGTFSSTNLMKGIESPSRKPGYDIPSYYDQYWISEGRGNSGLQLDPTAPTGTVREIPLSTNFIDVATTVTLKRNY